jgi:hypothetical protein
MNRSMLARAVNVVMVVVLLALAACTPTAEPTRAPAAPPAVAAATVLPTAPAPATPMATPAATLDWFRLIGDDLARRGPDGANQALAEFSAWAREASGIRDQLGAEADEIFRLVEEAQAALAQQLIRQLETGGKVRGLPALFPPRSSRPSEMGQVLAYPQVMGVFVSLIGGVGGNSGSVAQPSVIADENDKEFVEGVNGHSKIDAKLMGSQLEADVTITVVAEKDGKRYEEKASGKLSGNICPDEQGRVPLNLSLEISGSTDQGDFTMAFTVQAVGQVDDEANLVTVEEEIQAEMAVRRVNTWPFGGESTERAQFSFRIVSTGLLGDKGASIAETGPNLRRRNAFEAEAVRLVGALALLAMYQAYDKARHEWQSGCCVEVVVPEKRLVVGTGSATSITANVRHRFEGTDLQVPVVATLDSGAGSVTPAETRVPAPAAFVYAAPDEPGEAQVKLVSRSRRGIGEGKVDFTIRQSVYRVDTFMGSGWQVPVQGVIDDPELPFTLATIGKNPALGKYEGVIKFTPTDADGGTWEHTAETCPGLACGTASANGTYQLEGVAEGKPVLKMAATTIKSKVGGHVASHDWPTWEIELIPATR